MNERDKELAAQAGYKPLTGFDFANSLEETYLKKFADLIRADEREACAKVCEEGEFMTFGCAAEAIRARGNT